MALPVRYGGLGVGNPVQECDWEYDASIKITSGLKELIKRQVQDYDLINFQEIKESRKEVRHMKEGNMKEEYSQILEECDERMKRQLELAQEKGSSSWLTCLPLQHLGYCLNKQGFRDSLCLRYGWMIKGIPTYCACGTKSDVNHTLTCKKGGYVIMRHNALRDLEAELLREVCHDVRIEPVLLPTHQSFHESSNSMENARLDVSAIGLWAPFEKSYVDIRIFHPNAPSYINKNLKQVYKEHESEKKRQYNDRVINVERGTFTPLIFSTFGGMGKECDAFRKRIAQMAAIKRDEKYGHVMNYIRTRISFALLKSILVSLRGVRGREKYRDTRNRSQVSFNLIPGEDTE